MKKFPGEKDFRPKISGNTKYTLVFMMTVIMMMTMAAKLRNSCGLIKLMDDGLLTHMEDGDGQRR